MNSPMKTRISRLAVSYGPAAITGLLLFLSFPKIEWYYLAWIALAPLLVTLYDKSPADAFKAGMVSGLVYFFGTTYWIYHSINVYGSIPLVPSLFIVMLLCAYLGLYPAFFSVLYRATLRKTDLPALLIAPVFWTCLEFARSYALTGFPWSTLAYSQFRFLPLIQVADITGVYGVSFLIVAVNGAVADLFLMKKRHAKRPLSSIMPLVIGVSCLGLVLAASLVYGVYRLNQTRTGNNISVAVVQGNIEQDQKWDPVYQEEVVKVYEGLSTALSTRSPQLIVWPESSLPFLFGRDPKRTERLIEFQRSLGSYLLFGTILERPREADEEPAKQSSAVSSVSSVEGFTNSAVLLDRDGKVSYTYDKIHLVPFGEYVPLRSMLFFVDKLAFGIGDYLPGLRYTKAVTPFGSFGTLICYEIVFPGLVRKFYTHGGDFIVTITNDAWFGRTSGPYQHFSMAVFRAIENRKPVIRAANSGISGFIDSNGRIEETSALFKRESLMRQIRTDTTLTLYTKYGDLFSFFCIVASVFLLLIRAPLKR